MRIRRRLPAALSTIVAVGTTSWSAGLIAAGEGSQAKTLSGETLETVTVVGTRTMRSIDEVDATISVFNEQEIAERLYRDIGDLVRYEPGVSVGGSGSRFGLEGFSIRGMGGNRVLTLVDGIRVPEEFSFGPFQSATRNVVDIDQVARVEIARGPVSTLYGSDALGGVVAITTRAPNRYVSDNDPLHIDARLGYSSEDNSQLGAITTAYGTETLAGLISYSYRAGNETESAGGVGGTGPMRTVADPQHHVSEGMNLKLAWSPAEGHNLIVGWETFQGDVETNMLSDANEMLRGVLTQSRLTDDRRERERASLQYRWNGDGPIATAGVTLYDQQSTTTQMTLDEQLAQGRNRLRNRESLFEQQISGVLAQATSYWNTAASSHTVTYGVDVYRTRNSNLRTGGTTDLLTGEPVREFLPLPTRDFPRTQVENRALFIQDEIALMDGRLLITPGLRYDDYQATVDTDDIYLSGNPGVTPPQNFADSALTAKLGGLYHFSDHVSAWARYSEGFRAPPYDDVNVGFSNFIGGYKSIAAPDLEAETSTGLEAGLRFDANVGQLEITVFQTRYDNFIEALVPATQFATTGGIDPTDGLLTFQSINRDRVAIEGLELRGQLRLGHLNRRLNELTLQGALAYARGEDDRGVSVDTVDPLNLVLGARWESQRLPMSSELIWTWSDGRDAEDIATERPPIDSFSLLDLLVHYQLTEHLALDLGVFNLLDETYIRWADTAGIAEDAPGRFTQPGRNVSVNLRATF